MPETMRLDDLLVHYTPTEATPKTDPATTPVSTQVPVHVMNQFEKTPVVNTEEFDTWYEKLFKKTTSATEGAPDVIVETSAGLVNAVPDMLNTMVAGGLRLAGDIMQNPEQLIPKDPLMGAGRIFNPALTQLGAMRLDPSSTLKAAANVQKTFKGEGNAEDMFKVRKSGVAGRGQELSALGFYLHSQAKNFQTKMESQLDHPIAYDLGNGLGQLGFSFLAATVNPVIAVGVITGQVSATKYLENRAKNVPWAPSAAFSSTVGLAQGQLEKMSLGLLSKPFFSRWALAADAVITNAAQEGAQSLVESAGDEMVGNRDFDPLQDIKQAGYEAALGAFVGGAGGVTVINYSYNRIKGNLAKMGVAPGEQEALATRLLHSGTDIITELIKENSGVDQAYFDKFNAAMAGDVDPKEFFLEMDQQHDNDLKKRFVKLNGVTPERLEIITSEQQAKDITQAMEQPGILEQPLPIPQDIAETAKTIIEGRNNQLEAEISQGEERVTQLNEQLAVAQKEGKAHQDILDKLNKQLTDLDHLYVQQRDLTNYAVEELEKKKIQLQGSDVERVRKIANRVGEQSARRELTKTFKEKAGDIQARKDAVVHYVKKHIPKENRGEFLTAVRDVKTDKNLIDVVDKIYAKADEYQSKVLRRQIEEKLTKLGPEVDKGSIQKGRFGSAAIQDVADHIRQMAAMSAEEVALRQDANVQKIDAMVHGELEGDPSLLAFENELLTDFGAIASRSPEDLSKSLEALRRVSRNLRTLGQAVIEEETAKREARFAKIATEIKTPELEAKLDRQRDTVMGKLREVNQKFFGWGAGSSFNLGSMFQLVDNTKSGKGEISDLSGRLIDATRRESSYNTRLVDLFQTAFKSVYKVQNASQIEEKMRKDLSYETKDGAVKVDIVLNNGKGKTLILNRATVRYWYMLAHDFEGNPDAAVWETLTGQNAYEDIVRDAETKGEAPDLSRVKGNAIPEVELKRIFSTLTEQDKQFATRQKVFYNQTYLMINPVYRRVFGVNLPKVQNYVPRARAVDQTKTEMFSMLEDVSNQFGPSRAGALRLRNEKANAAFKEIGDLQIMDNMVLEMAHFLGTYETARDVFSILRNPDIRQAINEVSDGKQLKNGEWSDGTLYKRMITLAQVVGSRGKLHLEINAMAQRLSNNISSGAVAGQVELGVAQQMSFLAVVEDTPIQDVKDGIIDFFNAPMDAYKLLSKSPIIRMRYQNLLLEIQDLAKSTKMGNLSRKQDWRTHLFLPLKLGDKGSIILGGWVKFRSVYNQTQDLNKAYKALDTFIETTQQSGSLTQLSTSQTGYWKVFFKFLSAPQQYFRREVLSMNDVIKGRITPVEGIKRLMVYHFLLSGFFNLVKNLFQVPEDQLAKSVLVGPIVGVPIVGAIIEQLVMMGTNFVHYSVTGEPSKSRVNELSVPALSMANEILLALQSAEKNFEKDKAFAMLDAMMLAGESAAALTAGVPKQFGEVARGLVAASQGEIPVEALPLLLYGRTVNQVKNLFSEDSSDVSAMRR